MGVHPYQIKAGNKERVTTAHLVLLSCEKYWLAGPVLVDNVKTNTKEQYSFLIRIKIGRTKITVKLLERCFWKLNQHKLVSKHFEKILNLNWIWLKRDTHRPADTCLPWLMGPSRGNVLCVQFCLLTNSLPYYSIFDQPPHEFLTNLFWNPLDDVQEVTSSHMGQKCHTWWRPELLEPDLLDTFNTQVLGKYALVKECTFKSYFSKLKSKSVNILQSIFTSYFCVLE